MKLTRETTPAPGGLERPRGSGAGPAEMLWEARLTNDLLWALLSEEQRREVLAKRQG